MAFIVVQRLDPTHESLLSEILAKNATMAVSVATRGRRAAPTTCTSSRRMRFSRCTRCPGRVIRDISPGARRPDRKARGARKSGICKRRATQRGGMPRPGVMFANHAAGTLGVRVDNVDVLTAGGDRSHVTRRVNESEAAIVRRIFELSAAGAGLTRITKTLNDDGAPAPRAQQGRPRAWVCSSPRSPAAATVPRRVRVESDPETRPVGAGQPSGLPTDAWLRVDAPNQRIVPDDLWNAA